MSAASFGRDAEIAGEKAQRCLPFAAPLESGRSSGVHQAGVRPLDAFARAVNRVAAVLGSGQRVERDRVDRELLGMLAELAEADVCLLYRQEGDQFVAAASIGLQDDGASVDSAGFGATVNARELLTAATDNACTDAIRRQGVQTLFELRLPVNGDSVGVVYLGARHERPLSQEQADNLRAIAPLCAAVLFRTRVEGALEESVRARNDVLAVVVHDLKNPLNVISLAAGGLLKRLVDPCARRPAERVLRASQRAQSLIHDLLQIDAIEGGHFEIERRPVEVADVVLAALESQQALAAGDSIILASDLSPDLPTAEGDEERIMEVLENLAGNAVKFTPPGGSITVGASAREDELLLWVKDTGPGIAPEQLPHLFDRFWQARRNDRRGTGLGLTICKAIVEATVGVFGWRAPWARERRSFSRSRC
jgi:signal transduction histidine kinase